MDYASLLKVSFGLSTSLLSASVVSLKPNINININRIEKGTEKNHNFDAPWKDEFQESPSTFSYLNWHSRITKDIQGRDDELSALHKWVNSSNKVSVKLITGDGGVGKSRLAAQFAEELNFQGWNAGFFKYSVPEIDIILPDIGTLIVIDYPEEHLQVVESLIKHVYSSNYNGTLRILMLSRKPIEPWENEFITWGADGVLDMSPVALTKLNASDAFKLYIDALFAYAEIQGTNPQQFTAEEMQSWLDQDDENKRPLYILALALYCALNPEEKPVYHKSSEIIDKLVKRERARLANESKSIWGDGYRNTLEIIVSLATLAGGMSLVEIDAMRTVDDLKELFPKDITFTKDVTRSDIVRDTNIPALKPDIMATALVMKTLADNPRYASELVWQGVNTNLNSALDRFSRLCHDARAVFGDSDGTLENFLFDAVYNKPDRCKQIHDMFIDPPIPQSCLKTAIHVCEVLYENASDDEDKARYKNNLSNFLAAIGDPSGALEAIQEAMVLYRKLAGGDPVRFNPALAMSLNNLSLCLSDKGDISGALTTIQEAVTIQRRLAGKNPVRFNPVLANSLNNLSNCLSETGDTSGALEAIQDAVAIRRELAVKNPVRFNPALAMSLNNLSLRLADTGDTSGALEAIQSAVVLYRTLAVKNPVRFNPDFAMSLNNLSYHLSYTGDTSRTLEAIQGAVAIRRELAEKNPGRFNPDLASSLNNLSGCLADTGNIGEALEVIQEVVAIRRELAGESPGKFNPDLARSLGVMGNVLLDSSDVPGAITAYEDSIVLIRPFAEHWPGSPHDQMFQYLKERLARARNIRDEG